MPGPLFNILQAVLALGVPAFIALCAPRRWRPWATLLWALAPILIVLAVTLGALIVGGAGSADGTVSGVLAYSSRLLAPWLIACALGYAIGVYLRRKWRPAEGK